MLCICKINLNIIFWTFWKIRLGLDWIGWFPFKDGESALTEKRIFGQKISWPFTWKTWHREWYMSLSFSLMNNWLLLRWFMAIFITRSRTALWVKRLFFHNLLIQHSRRIAGRKHFYLWFVYECIQEVTTQEYSECIWHFEGQLCWLRNV